MRNLFLGLGFAFYSTLSLSASTIQVQDFNFEYKDPQGSGVAKVFSRTGFFTSEQLEVSVERNDSNFRIVASGAETEEFEFKNAPAFMTEAERMSVSGLNLSFNQNIDVNVREANFYSRTSSLGLDTLSLNCSRDLGHKEEIDQIISGCTKKMSLTSNKFSSSSMSSAMIEVLGGVGVSSLDFKIIDGKYNLQGQVKAQVSGRVKSSGEAKYDANSGVLTLKINEVKFGILSITGKVFDELRKNESDKLKVKQPYLYITLK